MGTIVDHMTGRNVSHHVGCHNPAMECLDRIRTALEGSEFQGKVYLVGGILRDRLLGREPDRDIDLVVVGDAVQLAHFLYRKGISDHYPVTYPRFGTARLTVDGVGVELTTAREERYDPTSRKPHVQPASLYEDAMRRDFTVNTLMEGLHDGVLLDLTGWGLKDLEARLIRTPRDPAVTFAEDPLRMLRAVRFAVTLDFQIEERTLQGIVEQVERIDLIGDGARVVSAERIRDEFLKIVQAKQAARGLQLLLDTGLLSRFLPELAAMRGVEQNAWHSADVWTHTLQALSSLPDEASLAERLAVLFHDVGKPLTRTEDERGVHFYGHETVGAEVTRRCLRRLRMPTALIHEVVELVAAHMRLGRVSPEWTEGAVRRLIREVGDRLESLFVVAAADHAALSPDAEPTDIEGVRRRIAEVSARMNARAVESPLDGKEIMRVLGVSPGPVVGQAKQYLISLILDGMLAPDDREGAVQALQRWRADAGCSS